MNSYFEQGGFYGQAAASAGADPSYRFPLGLAGMGMSPYAQHQPRPQDYDVAAAAAVSAASASVNSPKSSGLYSPLNNDSSSVYKSSSTTSSGSGGGGGGGGASAPPAANNNGADPSSAVDCKDQSNGYGSLSKELSAWGSTTPTSAGHGSSAAAAAAAAAAANGGVRPTVCTPDMTRYTPSAVDAVSARDRWMNSCSLTGSQAQPQLQQSANHTFYPWMAIAGKSYDFDIRESTLNHDTATLHFLFCCQEFRDLDAFHDC